MNRLALCCALVCLQTAGVVCSSAEQSGEPLHARIDVLIADRAEEPGLPASDAEFLRRVYLDLAGRIPSAEEARAFLADQAADKRGKLIEALLGGLDYPRRMQEAFDVMLMERRPLHPELKDRTGHDGQWMRFLHSSFAANKPWDQLVREILHPASEDEDRRGAAFFYTRRLEKWGQVPADFPGLVRDVGRLFLGVDLQCAECHDHLFIDDYTQHDYQGLAAFFLTVSLRGETKFPAIAEKPLAGKTEFTSVLTKAAGATGPRLPFGEELQIPNLAKGEEYVQPPDRKTGFPGVPRFSTLAELAPRLASADNPAFARNIANRMWHLMMGRGLIEPLDLSHAGNPPAHPKLLELLADELAAHQFDLKWLLRELALSRAYQRGGGDHQIDGAGPAALGFREKPLSPEQWMWSLLQATGQVDRGPPLEHLRPRFVAAFGNPPKVPETSLKPSIKGALFLMNDELVQSWLEARQGTLTDRLAKLLDDTAACDVLYLSVLARYPTEEERFDVSAALAHAPDADRRARILGNLAWALLASPEFGSNH